MLEPILLNHHKYSSQRVNGIEFFYKNNTRHKPGESPLKLLLSNIKTNEKALLDASSSAGYLAAFYENSIILDTSLANLSSAKKTFGNSRQLFAGAIWEFPLQVEYLGLIIPADKGGKRAEAEITGAYNSLQKGGKAYIVNHKDRGAKTYEKKIKTIFGNNRIIAKNSGWRLSMAIKESNNRQPVEKVEFEAGGLNLIAEPGVYAAGKLDPGSKFLLENVDMELFKEKTVLDIGAGYGIFSLKASLLGAKITALDDDLLAVKSVFKNAQKYGLDIRCLHSDVNSALKDEEDFDFVISNPPFHLGKQVKMDLPFAFIAAAHKHLIKGGEMFLVANKALAYEPLLKEFSDWRTINENKAFKLLWAKK